MTQPCRQCSDKAFNCTYDRVRKKRGPAGKRIESIWEQQGSGQARKNGERARAQTTSSTATLDTDYSGYDLQQTASFTSIDSSMLEDAAVTSHASQSPLGGSIDPTLMSPSQYTSNPTSKPGANIMNSNAIDNNLPLDSAMTGLVQNDFALPSLPMESPSSSPDLFGNIYSQINNDQVSEERWPRTVNEENLLPWIDVYFKRLHPTIPILNRTTMFHEMLAGKHYQDNQYGAMLLSLCAFAMTQPVQIHEVAEAPSRMVQARMLMEESIKMRVNADFGEQPTLEMILTSFYLFACLFGNNKHGAAWHRLREAVDLAQSLGIDKQQSYGSLDSITRERWLRTYLVLSVTERCVTPKSHVIDDASM